MARKYRNQNQIKENIAGYAFVMPALVTYVLLIAFPFFLTLILSFTKFNFLKVRSLAKLGKYISWIGLDNFRAAFRDPAFGTVMLNTAIVSCIITIV